MRSERPQLWGHRGDENILVATLARQQEQNHSGCADGRQGPRHEEAARRGWRGGSVEGMLEEGGDRMCEL